MDPSFYNYSNWGPELLYQLLYHTPPYLSKHLYIIIVIDCTNLWMFYDPGYGSRYVRSVVVNRGVLVYFTKTMSRVKRLLL